MTRDVWLVVVLGGLGTFLLRASALLVAGRTTRLSPRTLNMMRLIPPAVLSALVLPALVVSDEGQLAFGVPVIAGLVAVAVGLRTKNIIWPLLAGMAVAFLL